MRTGFLKKRGIPVKKRGTPGEYTPFKMQQILTYWVNLKHCISANFGQKRGNPLKRGRFLSLLDRQKNLRKIVLPIMFLDYVQVTCLIETLLLSTHTCFGCKIRKLFFCYTNGLKLQNMKTTRNPHKLLIFQTEIVHN